MIIPKEVPKAIAITTVEGEIFTLNGLTVIGEEKIFLLVISDNYARQLHKDLSEMIKDKHDLPL